MNKKSNNFGNKVLLPLLNLGLFVVFVWLSFQALYRIHYWALPVLYEPGETTLMRATGYALGSVMSYPLIIAIAVSFIPGFRRLPGRYFLAAGVLLFLFAFSKAYLIHQKIPQSECSALFLNVLKQNAGICGGISGYG